jgi:hypothetical protein
MRRYKPVDFPKQAAEEIIANGGTPVKAMVWERGNHVSFAMVSDDPSGRNEEIERHLSVSSSTNGVMREPWPSEIVYAADAIGWRPGEFVAFDGSNCTHVYKDDSHA